MVFRVAPSLSIPLVGCRIARPVARKTLPCKVALPFDFSARGRNQRRAHTDLEHRIRLALLARALYMGGNARADLARLDGLGDIVDTSDPKALHNVFAVGQR